MRILSCPNCAFGPLDHPLHCEWKFFCPSCFETWAIVNLTEVAQGVNVLRVTDMFELSDEELRAELKAAHAREGRLS